jgi:hypothetical protein
MDAEEHVDSAAIDAIGGSTVVARICDVTSQAVSQWRRNGIPKPWRKYLQLVRPEAFACRPEHRDEAPR